MTANTEKLPLQPAEGSLRDTPEFQMALAEEAAKMMANAKETLLAEVKSIMAKDQAQQVDQSGVSLAREIALAVAQMADQGTGMKRVPVEVLKAREEGQKDMERLLLAARDLPKSEWPRYRLIAAGYFKDELIQPFQMDPRTREVIPTEVTYRGIPGQHMKPLNKSAKAIYSAYLRSISNNEGSEVPIEHKPIWMTDSGVIITNGGTATARAHGRVIDPMGDDEDDFYPDAPDTSASTHGDFGIVNQDDPRAEEVRVLGTLSEPARRTSVVDRAARQMRGGH